MLNKLPIKDCIFHVSRRNVFIFPGGKIIMDLFYKLREKNNLTHLQLAEKLYYYCNRDGLFYIDCETFC